MTARGSLHRTPVAIVGVGFADGRFGRSDEWVRLREVGPSGALLARPDAVVDLRAEPPDDPVAAPDVALDRLVGTATALPTAGS